MLWLVLSPLAVAHETKEDDEDEFGLWEAAEVCCEGCCDSKCSNDEELRPFRFLRIALVERFHGSSKRKGKKKTDENLKCYKSELSPDILATLILSTWCLCEGDGEEDTKYRDSNDVIKA